MSHNCHHTQNLPDKEGRRCLFCVKTYIRTYEMSASNLKQRVDWVQGEEPLYAPLLLSCQSDLVS